MNATLGPLVQTDSTEYSDVTLASLPATANLLDTAWAEDFSLCFAD